MGVHQDIGALLRFSYAEVADELPQVFTELLEQLAAQRGNSGKARSERQFKAELTQLIPALRSFARRLCRDPELADDLVQDTMMRAWAARERFQPGTSMKAWTHTILRNGFLSLMRRNRFTGDWDDTMMETMLSTGPTQEAALHLADVERGLARMTDAQRNALLLVGADQLTYEETAELCRVPLGTIKSRVARGRAALAQFVEGSDVTA